MRRIPTTDTIRKIRQLERSNAKNRQEFDVLVPQTSLKLSTTPEEGWKTDKQK
jgi:hypothetical protein